ncbi:MAG TPA: DUF1127 domain-containing protein [Rubellimicrobium sp.]|nr:DUF1127 domain-containing protein [Rubellimicrobium sp.]
MTYATHADRSAVGPSIRQRLSDLAAGLAQRRAQRQAFRSTLRELSAMSSRDLLDIGIHPADVHAVARLAAYGA